MLDSIPKVFNGLGKKAEAEQMLEPVSDSRGIRFKKEIGPLRAPKLGP